MYKILVVDDEPLEVQSLVYIIKNKMSSVFGKIETARSGREAIEKSKAFNPDIVLMDINMPGINGIDAINAIKSSGSAEFIITTAFDYFDYAVQAITLGVKEYLLKPIKSQQMVNALEKLVKSIEQKRTRLRYEVEIKEKYELALHSLEQITISYNNLLGLNKTSYVETNPIIKKADEFINENYSREITLEDIAKAVNLSPFYFSHFYKEKTGKTFIDTLIHRRISKAKELIETTDSAIKEISVSVGYYDQNYFSKLFKKVTGITPSEYKENIRTKA